MRYQNERVDARRLQRSGSSRGTRKETDLQDLFSIESCRLSVVDYIEEKSPESPRRMQDEQEATSEASWNATGKGRRRVEAGTRRVNEDAGNHSLWSEVEGVPVN